MEQHAFFADFAINCVCFLITILFGNYLYYIRKIKDINFGTCLCLCLLWLLAYLCAKLLHVSWVVVPIDGGISWTRLDRLAFFFWAFVVATIFFYIKSRFNKKPPILPKADHEQKKHHEPKNHP